MAQTVSLAASPRQASGKGGARQIRFRGKVPAVIYGHGRDTRSEEHTSELQSQSNLVCRLLLEKKKTNSSISPRFAHSRSSIDLYVSCTRSRFMLCSRESHCISRSVSTKRTSISSRLSVWYRSD